MTNTGRTTNHGNQIGKRNEKQKQKKNKRTETLIVLFSDLRWLPRECQTRTTKPHQTQPITITIKMLMYTINNNACEHAINNNGQMLRYQSRGRDNGNSCLANNVTNDTLSRDQPTIQCQPTAVKNYCVSSSETRRNESVHMHNVLRTNAGDKEK